MYIAVLALTDLIQSCYAGHEETAVGVSPRKTRPINVTKPYKRRRLKMDPVHVMQRKVNKMKSRNPNVRRKAAIYRKKYVRRNKMALEKRSKFVRKAQKHLPPAPHQVGEGAPKRGTPSKSTVLSSVLHRLSISS